MLLVTGLGNPGMEYAASRHNVGFMVADRLAGRSAAAGGWLELEGGLLLAAVATGGEFRLHKPMRYMNRSGPPVAAALARIDAGVADLLVIHDDLDLPFGRVKLSSNRGAGGHNGVASIIAALDSKAFHRLRIGIGRPAAGQAVSEYVLERFTRAEEELLGTVLDRCVDCVLLCLASGFSSAMNVCNQVSPAEPTSARVDSSAGDDALSSL
ncbi:MAG: aminoacyl-tRNA hydrolase [Thermodesulfobacteriota bacterium]